MSVPDPLIDTYFTEASRWRNEMSELRKIVLSCKLTEKRKWKYPWYTINGKNIVGIYGFKNYAALLFMKGSLLTDPYAILVSPGENAESGRLLKFTDTDSISKNAAIIREYITEAIQIEKAGLKVAQRPISSYAIPDEFQTRLSEDEVLREAFTALTPGRQKGYLLYFSAAKQSSTREKRIVKCIPLILDGLGLHDYTS